LLDFTLGLKLFFSEAILAIFLPYQIQRPVVFLRHIQNVPGGKINILGDHTVGQKVKEAKLSL
jgi:hypothetical protein